MTALIKMVLSNVKEKYKKYMSLANYHGYDTLSATERQHVDIESKRALQRDNIDSIRAKATGMKFLGVVSHELRTPLNSLVGVIDLMQADRMTHDQKLYIKTLEQSCSQLLSVVNRMQDLAALQSETQGMTNNIPFDIVATVTGVAESMQHLSSSTGKGTQVEVNLDPSLPRTVNADFTKIQQILSNLVAIAATSSRAKLATIETRFHPVAPDGFLRSPGQEQQHAYLYFTITGCDTQTPKDTLDGLLLGFSYENLFQPSTFNNMSQGIVISREFLAQLNSKLEMLVDDANALIFSFAVHVTYDPGVTSFHATQGDIVANRTAVRILLTEDNKVNQMVARKMLNKLGFTNVDSAWNGQEAIEILSSKTYDIILLDCDMPVMDGYEAASHIRNVMKDTTIKIVALTANNTNEAKTQCLAAGMDDFFTKPITMKTLSEMLHKWLSTDGIGGHESNCQRKFAL